MKLTLKISLACIFLLLAFNIICMQASKYKIEENHNLLKFFDLVINKLEKHTMKSKENKQTYILTEGENSFNCSAKIHAIHYAIQEVYKKNEELKAITPSDRLACILTIACNACPEKIYGEDNLKQHINHMYSNYICNSYSQGGQYEQEIINSLKIESEIPINDIPKVLKYIERSCSSKFNCLSKEFRKKYWTPEMQYIFNFSPRPGKTKGQSKYIKSEKLCKIIENLMPNIITLAKKRWNEYSHDSRSAAAAFMHIFLNSKYYIEQKCDFDMLKPIAFGLNKNIGIKNAALFLSATAISNINSNTPDILNRKVLDMVCNGDVAYNLNINPLSVTTIMTEYLLPETDGNHIENEYFKPHKGLVKKLHFKIVNRNHESYNIIRKIENSYSQ
jgi:hypothetical protein